MNLHIQILCTACTVINNTVILACYRSARACIHTNNIFIYCTVHTRLHNNILIRDWRQAKSGYKELTWGSSHGKVVESSGESEKWGSGYSWDWEGESEKWGSGYSWDWEGETEK